MLLLAIDTAGPDCAAALARPDGGRIEIMARSVERIGRGHAERLMPVIETALAHAGVSWPELSRIAVTTGPGSFTGVRIGVAAARALALALAIPVIGVDSLAALAVGVPKRGAGTVVAVLDAKRGEVYAMAQRADSGCLLIAPKAASTRAITEELRTFPGPFVLAGSGAAALAAELGPGLSVIASVVESPDIADVAMLGLRADPGEPPLPLYLRGADAKPQAGKALARV